MNAPITDGATLVRALRNTGTGDAKLTAARAVLSAKHATGTRATSGEVIDALLTADVPALTIEKARILAATGDYVVPVTLSSNIEDLMLDAPAAHVAVAKLTEDEEFAALERAEREDAEKLDALRS